jgi:stealth protein CR2/Stealth-like protein
MDVVPLRVQQQIHRALPGPAWRLLRDMGTGATPWQQRLRRTRLERMRRSVEDAIDGPVTAVTYRDERFLARPVERFRALDTTAANAALVADAMEQAGVRHLVVDVPAVGSRTIAVADTDRAAAWAALVAAGSRRAVYVREVHPRATERSVRLSTVRGAGPEGDAWTVFEVLAAPGSTDALCGPELGCVLEVWRELPEAIPDDHATGEPLAAGSWVAPRRNRWVDAVPGDIGEPAHWDVDGVRRAALPALGQRHMFDVDFPIDVVYTWVDGSDPAWRERKTAAHAAVGLGELNEYASNESRFLSRDELRYSLRSLDTYANWARHIYLVTDDQTPEWLDTANPRITVVSHRELFGDRGRLPTFNSHAIETQLHHIPGLSDHFLYLNDDFFFGRPVDPRLFFDGNGIARFFTSTAKLGLGPTGAFDRPVMSGGKNNRDLLFKAFGRTATNKFKHVPQSLLKDVLLELEERFPEEFAATASHQFRNPGDLSVLSSLHHHYAYLRGRAVEGSLQYLYADIAAPTTARRLERFLRARDQDTFCLNDHDASGVDPLVQQRMLHSFLSRYFPLPSSFER